MIRIEGVHKSFGDTKVLRGINLNVPKGCLYGLIGPGASGKSVLLKLIPRLLEPDRGSITVDNTDLSTLSPLQLQNFRARFGMLFQNNALFDYLTVGDNIAFPLRRLFDLSDEEVQDRVIDRLKKCSLPGFEKRLCAGLSGGQKKRVGVARATVTRAEIVLYDEPAAGLDPVTSQRIFELLRLEQRETNSTVLMVSSDLDRMLSVTDRVGMLLKGELIFDGTTDEAKNTDEPRVRQFVHGLTEGPL